MENGETADSPILKEEVEKAVRMLKNGKSPGVDNIKQDAHQVVGQAKRHATKIPPKAV